MSEKQSIEKERASRWASQEVTLVPRKKDAPKTKKPPRGQSRKTDAEREQGRTGDEE